MISALFKIASTSHNNQGNWCSILECRGRSAYFSIDLLLIKPIVPLGLSGLKRYFQSMEELQTNYQGSRVRYYVFGGNDLLLNANDVSAIIGGKPEVCTGKYIDLAEAIGISIVDN